MQFSNKPAIRVRDTRAGRAVRDVVWKEGRQCRDVMSTACKEQRGNPSSPGRTYLTARWLHYGTVLRVPLLRCTRNAGQVVLATRCAHGDKPRTPEYTNSNILASSTSVAVAAAVAAPPAHTGIAPRQNSQDARSVLARLRCSDKYQYIAPRQSGRRSE